MAEAEATGKPINLTHMAVGDGGGKEVDPDPGQTQLVREIANTRRAPNRVFPDADDDTLFTAELVIPADLPGFTIREIGVYDADGGLFAVGNLPPAYKAHRSEGAVTDAVVRLRFMVTNAAVVSIVLDPNVAVATQTWISNNVTPATLLPGGTTHQVLRKRSNANGDTEWANAADVNVLVNTVEEEQELADGQTTVDLSRTTTYGLAVYIDGTRLPNKEGAEGWRPHETVDTRLVLGQAYPAGTTIICVQNEPASQLANPLEKQKNLADVPDKAAARGNLDVLSKAESTVIGKAPGDVFYTARSTAPSGSLKANGAAISRTAYAALFAVIGTTYGAGDGFNTFNLPDLRGEFLRGLDDGRGVDANRGLGSTQAGQILAHAHSASSDAQGAHSHTGRMDAQGNHAHTGQTSADGEHNHTNGIFTNALRPPYVGSLTGNDTTYSGSEQAVGAGDSAALLPAGRHSHTLETSASGTHTHGLTIDGVGAHTHGITVHTTGGTENRPRNVALLACIQY